MGMDALAGERAEHPAPVGTRALHDLVERDPKPREQRRIPGNRDRGLFRPRRAYDGEDRGDESRRDDATAQRYTGFRFSKKDAIASRPSGATALVDITSDA